MLAHSLDQIIVGNAKGRTEAEAKADRLLPLNYEEIKTLTTERLETLTGELEAAIETLLRLRQRNDEPAAFSGQIREHRQTKGMALVELRLRKQAAADAA